MERIAMSQEERDELEWLKRAKEGRITQREAAEKIGVTERWVRTLIKRLNKQGDAVVISGVATGIDNTRMLATSVIAGVEPILEPAPQRQGGQNLGGDWGLEEISPPQ